MSVKRFQRLLKIRQAQENEVAVALAGRLGELHRVEQQRDQLLDYQQQYFNANLPSESQILKQIAYMQQQLRAALQQQELRIAAAETQVEQVRTVWMEAHQASLSLEKLIERRRRSADIVDGRKQQREQDLWATRQAFQKPPNE